MTDLQNINLEDAQQELKSLVKKYLQKMSEKAGGVPAAIEMKPGDFSLFCRCVFQGGPKAEKAIGTPFPDFAFELIRETLPTAERLQFSIAKKTGLLNGLKEKLIEIEQDILQNTDPEKIIYINAESRIILCDSEGKPEREIFFSDLFPSESEGKTEKELEQ